MMIEALRTPDEQFRNLPGYTFRAHHISDLPGYEGLRLSYLDEGPAGGDVVLCLHGEPTWSYLYRKMVPVFVGAGLRVVVPDYFGFGRSDKPVHDEVYTFDFHRDALLAFIDALGLRAVTLVVQDWGGLLGLTLPLDRPDLVARLLIMNTALGTGNPPGEGFMAWRRYMAETPDLDIAGLMQRAVPQLGSAEAAAYAAPWPAARYKAGVRRFPALVPITPTDPGAEMSRSAAAWWSQAWSGPTFLAVGINDPILGPPVMSRMRQLIRGCPEPMLVDEGHFVPESGDLVARAALEAWS